MPFCSKRSARFIKSARTLFVFMNSYTTKFKSLSYSVIKLYEGVNSTLYKVLPNDLIAHIATRIAYDNKLDRNDRLLKEEKDGYEELMPLSSL